MEFASKLSSTTEELQSKIELAGQSHLIEQLPNLFISSESSEQHPIYQQLIRWNVIDSIRHFHIAKEEVTIDGDKKSASIKPVNEVADSRSFSNEENMRLQGIGRDSISNGKVGAVILSGGQGTRLGFAGPKGMYDMGLPSHKTIFQIHIERIAKVRCLVNSSSSSTPPSSCKIPIYIMTSDLNDQIIKEYFAKENYFGYPQEDIYFFEQGLMPCLTMDGKIIIESETSLSLAPDGNGGIYNALLTSGAIDDMRSRGIEHLHIYGIDNVLTKSIDPLFLGFFIDRNVQCGNKVVWKANKSEKVGVTAINHDNRMCVVEYSELPIDMADAINEENGKVIFGAANICNHYMTVDFLYNIVIPQISSSYHLAAKKIPFLDPITRKTVTPTSNNGMKLEMFIFDVFPLAERWAVLECEREDEFAPVKNEPGNPVDSPDSARAMMTAQGKKWLENIGAEVVIVKETTKSTSGEADTETAIPCCEISPMLSYGGEGLESYRGKKIQLPAYLC